MDGDLGSGGNFPLGERELPALSECSNMDSTPKTRVALNMQNIAREAEMINRKEQAV